MKGNNSAIVNPFALTILTLKINDQGQTHIDTQLPPKETVKALANLVVDLTFQYAEQLAAAAQLGRLQLQEEDKLIKS